MHNFLDWFIKSMCQHQLFFQYEDPTPTIEQIQSFISYFESIFPHVKIQSLIAQLHKTLSSISDLVIVPPLIYDQITTIHSQMFDRVNQAIESRILKTRPTSQLTQDPFVSIDFRQLNKIALTTHPSICRMSEQQRKCLRMFHIANQAPPLFRQPQDESCFEFKQHVIRCYVQKGYAMAKFRQYCTVSGYKCDQSFRAYLSSNNSVLTQAFRAFQRFLQNQCSLVIQPVSKLQQRLLYSILLNLRNFIQQQNLKVFHAFLTSLFDLAQKYTSFSAFSVYRAYQSILKVLIIREKEMSAIRNSEESKLSVFRQKEQKLFMQRGARGEKHKLKKWDAEKELQLVNFYLKNQSLVQIRQKYRETYGKTTAFEEMMNMRSQLYKIIRKSLQRAQRVVSVYADQFDKSIDHKINLVNDSKNRQYVLTSPQFSRARVLLCQLFKEQGTNFGLVREIANQLEIALGNRCSSDRPSKAGTK